MSTERGPSVQDCVRQLLLLMPRLVGRAKRMPPPVELQNCALAPRHLSLLSYLLFDGPMTVTACSVTDHSCEQYTKCNIRDPLWRIKDRIVSALSATSVADLAIDIPAPPPALVGVPMSVVKRSLA